jgi:hypothetical protein
MHVNDPDFLRNELKQLARRFHQHEIDAVAEFHEPPSDVQGDALRSAPGKVWKYESDVFGPARGGNHVAVQLRRH